MIQSEKFLQNTHPIKRNRTPGTAQGPRVPAGMIQSEKLLQNKHPIKRNPTPGTAQGPRAPAGMIQSEKFLQNKHPIKRPRKQGTAKGPCSAPWKNTSTLYMQAPLVKYHTHLPLARVCNKATGN